MSITVRSARPNDYEAVKALFSQMLTRFAETYPKQYRKEGAEASLKLQTFLNTLENEEWAFLVATEDDKILGAVQLSTDKDEDSEYRHPHTYAWIEELIVDQAANLEDVATALLTAAQTWAREKSITTLDFVVYALSPEVLELCQKHGFTTVSTRVRQSL